MVEDFSKTCELVSKSGVNFSMTSNLRTFGPPTSWIGFAPQNSEVLVGNLPLEIFEYDLLPILGLAGRIYTLKLKVNYKGFKRGFAFVQYYTPEEAKKAIESLNNYEIEPGQFMTVSKPRKNCRLYISNLSTSVKKHELSNLISDYVENVVDVYFDQSCTRDNYLSINKGYAYLEFLDYDSAEVALKKLSTSEISFDDKKIDVSWVTSLSELGEKLKEDCTLIFKNFKVTLSNEEIYNFLSDNRNLEIVLFKRVFDQVLVSFNNEENAKQALKNYDALKDKTKLISLLENRNKISLNFIDEYTNLKIFCGQVNYKPKEINNNQDEEFKKNLKELLESLNKQNKAENESLTKKCCFNGNCEVDDFYKYSKIHVWTQKFKSV